MFRAFSCSVCAVAARRRGCSFCKRSLPFGRHSEKLLTDISCLLQTTNKNLIRCLQKHLILNQESNPADYISSTRHSRLRVARPNHLKFWVSKYCVKCDKYSLKSKSNPKLSYRFFFFGLISQSEPYFS